MDPKDRIKIDPNEIGLNPTTDPNILLLNVLNTVYVWAGIIAVIVIVVAGYIYVTSGGNASRVTRAKDAILGAVIGIVIILVAFTVTQFVLGQVG